MKNQLLSIIVLALLTLTACKQAETTENATDLEVATEVEVEETVDHTATFNKRMGVLRAFIKSHTDEDIEALSGYIADTIAWSPPSYSKNPWLGKEEYMAALKGYHDNYDNITYTEGIVLPGTTGLGFFSGNVHSADGTVNSGGNAIRSYGTWHATHTTSGKSIGVKWFSVTSFNEDDKIVMVTDYWDVNGLAAQIAEE